jgi:hypothetical protein
MVGRIIRIPNTVPSAHIIDSENQRRHPVDSFSVQIELPAGPPLGYFPSRPPEGYQTPEWQEPPFN